MKVNLESEVENQKQKTKITKRKEKKQVREFSKHFVTYSV